METRKMQYWNNENHYEIVSPCAKYVAVIRWKGNLLELVEIRTIATISEDEMKDLMNEYQEKAE
jgi:hypothetical protein